MSDWDSTTTIGSRANRAKVTSESGVNATRQAGGSVATDKKVTGGTNKGHAGTDHQKIAKLDRDNEVAPPATVSLSLSKAIQQARLEAKLTQKELAQAVNETSNVISDYESGKAIPNPGVLAKLERKLKVKLRGKDIGTPLAPPGSKK